MRQDTIAIDLLSEAIALHKMGKLNEAESMYRTLLASQPQNAHALNLLGTLYFQQGKHAEGIHLIEKAIILKPDYAEAYYNYGQALQFSDRHEEALKCYDKAIGADSGYIKAYNNRGLALYHLGRYDEAVANYNKAIAINPDYADAYWNKSLIKLLLGEYEEGWKLYEWRWERSDKTQSRVFQQPLWLGKELLADKTILLHAEQGLGDTIQFSRYVPMTEALGAKIILEVSAPLVKLFSTLRASFHLVTRGAPLPNFDMHCPLESLPLAFDTRIDTIPANVPYLFADPHKQEIWRDHLANKVKPRIGLVWSGTSRRIPLDLLTPLWELNFDYHSLQKEITPEDEVFLRANSPITSHGNDLKDLSDTAALLSEMDLIISVDTGVAHLAGALGKPVWILLNFAPDFRWMTEREDSPWYPTARLFRQQQPDNWVSVIDQIKSELKGVSGSTDFFYC